LLLNLGDGVGADRCTRIAEIKHWRGFQADMLASSVVPEAGIDRPGFMRPAEAMA
jgi:hypothetical protein